MTGEAVEGYTNKETFAVGLFLNNTQDYQRQTHTALRGIDWDRAMANKVVLIDKGAFDRVRANIAGEILRDVVDSLLGPAEEADQWTSEDVPLNVPPGRVIFTEEQYSAIRDIGSLWRVDWDQLGAEFLHDLTEIED